MRRDVAVGHPDFGQVFPCACTTTHPEVLRQQYQQRLAGCGLPPTLRDTRLDAFQVVDDTTQEARDAVRNFVSARRTGGAPAWVTLFGQPGRGKSHLLAAAVTALLARQAVVYWTLPELLRACKAASNRDGEPRPFAEDEALTATARQADVLVLDEFGAPAADRAWAWEKQELLLKHRYDAGLPLLLGMTCSPEELRQRAPALFSRVGDRTLGQSVVIAAPDYRLRLRARPAALATGGA